MAIAINGKDLILGRLASFTAKKISQENTEIIIYNAKKIVISGQKKNILARYKERRKKGDPIKGPFFPKTPVGLVRRAVRGMIGYTNAEGKARFKLLKIYERENYNETKDIIKVEVKDAKALEKSKYITIEQLSNELGYNK